MSWSTRGLMYGFSWVRLGWFGPGMMPPMYIFSGLYQISAGRLRQTIEIRPTDVLVPQMCMPSMLRKSTFMENKYCPSVPLSTNRVFPSGPFISRKNSARHMSLTCATGGFSNCSIRVLHNRSTASSKSDRDRRPAR